MNKIVFFLGVLLMTSTVSLVQGQSNTLLMYGSLAIDSQNFGSANGNSYSIAPGVGYQWNNQWTAGLNLALSGSNYIDKASSVSVGPFIRYTQSLAGVFAIYAQLNTNYLSGKTTGVNFNGFQGTLFPAIGMNLKNSFALNFSFGSLSLTTQSYDGGGKAQTAFHVGFGSGASFGISKNFGLKQ